MDCLRVVAVFTVLLSLTTCSKKHKNVILPQKDYIKLTMQYKSVSGVSKNLLSLDIYHFGERGALKPVVIYVHGGGFVVGDKANNMINKVNLFSSLNYILISVNYRLTPAVYSTDPNRVMYPDHHNDVADAVKWVYDNIENYGGNNQKIALLGHSAGAQLIALIGTSALFLPPRGLPLNGIKGVACIDTDGYDVVARCNENNQVYLNAFGHTGTGWFEASPINNLFNGTDYPNFFIAKRGDNIRVANANSFITKLQSVGVSVKDITANAYNHEGINNAIGEKGETLITEPLKKFFAQCFL